MTGDFSGHEEYERQLSEVRLMNGISIQRRAWLMSLPNASVKTSKPKAMSQSQGAIFMKRMYGVRYAKYAKNKPKPRMTTCFIR